MSRDAIIDPLESWRQERRIRAWFIFGWVVLALISARLWQIQIIESGQYRTVAISQSSRVREVLPPRGVIIDRHGAMIVDNQPGIRLRFHPDRTTSPARTQALLERVLERPPADLAARIQTARRRQPFRPETLVEQLSRDDLARLAAVGYEHPELELQTTPLRRYPHGSYAAHLLGYLGEVNDHDLARLRRFDRYQLGDVVGKQGVERIYEPWLFGTKGLERFRVDARGRVLERLEMVAPRAGWDLRLTLDWNTQMAAEEALGVQRGAIVALDPRNGDVLALVSHPAFDPAMFVGGISGPLWASLRDNPEHPLEYRPIRGQYPPGSTFKPLTALAALEAGVVTPEEQIPCTGYYRLGRRTFRCWRAGGHGRVNLHRAMVVSCDTYFYEIGRRTGIERLAATARRFGFGRTTGIDIEGEKEGLVPGPEWKRRVTGEPWQEGETIIAAIGQGSVLTTPLQMATFFATLANGGKLVVPQVMGGFENRNRPSPLPAPQSPTPATVSVDPAMLEAVRRSIVDAVMGEEATGVRARIPGLAVAGKTGTAQVVQQARRGEELEGRLRDHGWFVAWAPADDPRIVVSVLVENSGSGGTFAAPLARRIIAAHLGREGVR